MSNRNTPQTDAPEVQVPYCLPPLPLDAQQPAAFDIPAGACDTHAHVVAADDGAYPMVPNRTYTPHPATEDAYLAMLAANGMSRGVLVQISVYGTDNRYMLEVLRRHPDKLRGIGVVDADVADSELEAMHAAGVRGLRINVLFGGGIGFDAMETLAHRIKDLGWHMQFLMDARQLPEMLPRMQKLPVPGVVDHMGHMPVAEGTRSAGFQALQRLVRDHGWWVKLSGAYRISSRFDDYPDVTPWAQALIETAPDRMVFGSDWPHVHISPMVNTGKLRNQLAAWAPDAALRRRILVDNPQRLYDFPAA
ncbi:GntR family transcriptional regulator [Bordetella genomosp. 10]|uniref:GntR family transcriptional regulator n=1 Tax=Bordetella genomosp. 10 TaxID=1416804 RepID=A0A261SAM7_9BORD|nr:amidohydrolase family protein [Bordetella genomosp. 10]OZI34454.1 GntR family transcriptional regulator [Bordetella genomosp. 10]